MSRQIVFDTETTGLSVAEGNRLVEIGGVELLARKLSGHNLHLYLNPERESEEGALRVHGLTREFLQDKPKFADVVDQFLDYVRGAELIIHNAAFDVGFIDSELARLGRAPLASYVSGVIDTLAMAKEMFPGKNNSLNGLCSRLGVDNTARQLHGALLDAELLADVYINLTRGQDALLIADDESSHGASPGLAASPAIDLRGIELQVLQANAQELAAHEELLAQLDKASGGKTIWRLAQEAQKTVP